MLKGNRNAWQYKYQVRWQGGFLKENSSNVSLGLLFILPVVGITEKIKWQDHFFSYISIRKPVLTYEEVIGIFNLSIAIKEFIVSFTLFDTFL
jgi:hypothetical protein